MTESDSLLLKSSSAKGTKSRLNVKHVSKACLECRSRHLKCSGEEPCGRCKRLSRQCSYVKSHRGGSRKKGVSKAGKKRQSVSAAEVDTKSMSPVSMSANSSGHLIKKEIISMVESQAPELDYYIPPVEDLIKLPCIKHKNSENELKKKYSDLLRMPCAFTCLEPQYRGRTPPCMGGNVIVGAESHQSLLRNGKSDPNLLQIPVKQTSTSYEKVNSQDYIKKLMTEVNITTVIDNYYGHFHNLHPFLPNKNEILGYIESVPHCSELILAMKLIGDAQTSSLYATDMETVNFKLHQIFDYINTVVGVDLVSLQALALVSLTAHFSSLHDLSTRVRFEAVKSLLDHGYNKLDADELRQSNKSNSKPSPEYPISPGSSKDSPSKLDVPVLSSERLQNLSESTILENARKIFWEFQFIDVIIGTADGKTISDLATAEILVSFPKTTRVEEFDYKTRAEGCMLVSDAIRLNIAVIDQAVSSSAINHLNASLGNWELRISHPGLSNSLSLVNASGKINEGVFQAMLLYNYARIFVHRPFSYLWKDMASDVEKKLGPNKATINSRKIIETRKTIEGANLIARCLLDTSPASIKQRTPLYGCAIAFASLVHLSSYIWFKSSQSTEQVEEEELREYLELIQFELNTLAVLARNWMLPNKLSNYVKETLFKVVPELYESIKDSISLHSSKLSPGVTVEQVDDSVRVDDSSSMGKVINFSELSVSADAGAEDTGGADRNEYNEIDFNNYDFNSRMPGVPDSPMSDTGCDWIDKNVFEFDEDEFKNILETCIQDE